MHHLRRLRAALFSLAFSTVGVVAASDAAHAQTATLFGALSNFDVLNDTGENAYGFEIDLPGVQLNTNFYYFFTWNRYGTPAVVPYAGGTYIRYMAQWDATAQAFTTATPPATDFSPTNGHMCVMGVLGYATSGCEHFGVGVPDGGVAVHYHWLVADPTTPGGLVRWGSAVAIGAPVWSVQPPAVAGEGPVVVAEVEAPEPAELPELYGDAQWMKVYETELPHPVALEDLLTDDPNVPNDPSQVEVSWEIVQDEPARNGNGNSNRRGHRQNQGAIRLDTQAVVRRYEFYKFTGSYDPITHEALCGDLACNAPGDGELGDYIGAQMAAANVEVNQVVIERVGNGIVQASGGVKLKCGTACSGTAQAGAAVTLTANPSGEIWKGWGGDCAAAGLALTCNVSVVGRVDVVATFVPALTLSVRTSNKGVVASNPAGIDCGGSGSCSGKFGQGDVVALTATPPAGKTFLGWGGACSGTAPRCSVTMSSALSVQANFSK
ncbi:MAG: hypothetical protein U1F43_19660 [Myxococcota bacterium]